MLGKRIWICTAVLLLVAAIGSSAALTNNEKLGKKLFFDEDLSNPRGQACASCHGSDVGFTGPDSRINSREAVYPGAVDERSGNRKPPSAAYGGDSPILDHTMGDFTGGMFWDGRATGWTLGDPLAEQAEGPFLNPLEQNNPSEKAVVDKVLKSDYNRLFKQICGDKYNVTDYYICIARSIAAYERSSEVSAYTSKYDAYIAGKVRLSSEEEKGMNLFMGDKAKCANCHVPPLFTDFTYDNLGVPKNPKNPFYTMPPKWNPAGLNWVDMGLGGFLNTTMDYSQYVEQNYGKQKVPTLRNVDKRPNQRFVKAYSHNGYFKSLEEIVHFYNTRDIQGAGWKGQTWPAAEVPMNVNTDELGDLGLTQTEESAIVAFMKMLSDGYMH